MSAKAIPTRVRSKEQDRLNAQKLLGVTNLADKKRRTRDDLTEMVIGLRAALTTQLEIAAQEPYPVAPSVEVVKEDFDPWRAKFFPKNMGSIPHVSDPTPKYYGKWIGGRKIDIYQILVTYEITHPAIAHAIKKLLRYGRGGNLSQHQDVQGALDSLLRWQEMEGKEGSFTVAGSPADMRGAEPAVVECDKSGRPIL